MTTRIAIIAAGAFMLSAFAYAGAIYGAEVERQETARMQACQQAGGRWTAAWNWRTYCAYPERKP